MKWMSLMINPASTPIAVLISDVHYNLQTLQLADAAMRQAIARANGLNVPLIVCGDLHDTKANLRGECVNQMIETFKSCRLLPYVIIGNHDLLNEKGKEHSLNFLSDYADIVSASITVTLGNERWQLIPYQTNPKDFLNSLEIPFAICHQGIKDGHAGDYIQDHSAITKADVAGLRVISGHYHTRQTIDLLNNGKWDYVGNPFSLTWGEAKDPEKGYQILYDDGSLVFVPTNLRKHVVVSCTHLNYKNQIITAQADDLVWIKILGPYSAINNISRKDVANAIGRDVFKLTLDVVSGSLIEQPKTDQTQEQILDSILDKTENPDRLKKLWRGLCE